MTLYSIKKENKGSTTIWTVWIQGASRMLDWFPTREAAERSVQAHRAHDMAFC